MTIKNNIKMNLVNYYLENIEKWWVMQFNYWEYQIIDYQKEKKKRLIDLSCASSSYNRACKLVNKKFMEFSLSLF